MIGDRRELVIAGMLKRIRHRGPDDEGYRMLDEAALGSVRLSIVDPAGGNQPMRDPSGAITLVYNGELYGYSRLRRQLERKGYVFRSHSDTEVFLAAYRNYGLDFVSSLNGMFAGAIHDARRNAFILVRDHFGIKPVLYTVINKSLYFSSEAKAYKAIPEWTAQPDFNAWHAFMNVRFTPQPLTLFKDVFKLPPGSYMVVGKDDRNAIPIPEAHELLSTIHFGEFRGAIYRYYHLPNSEMSGGEEEDPAQLETLLEQAVADHVSADTPVGVFLSGGLDSSTLAYYAAGENTGETTSVCLGLGEGSDENEDARNVAETLGIRHFDTVLDQSPFDEYRHAVYHMEEPKVNCLQGWFASREAGRHCKAMLSGLGADELFGGYDIYQISAFLDLASGRLPRTLEGIVGRVGKSILSPFSNPRMDLYRRMADLLKNGNDPLGIYLILRNAWDHDPTTVRKIYTRRFSGEKLSPVRTHFDKRFPCEESLPQSFMRFEFENKMVDDFLMNEDRMSMAHGLEVRVPFLDRRVVEFAVRLPIRARVGLLHRKRILRDLMKDILPKRILAKKKHGFTFDPVAQFGHGLGPYLRQYLTEDRVNKTDLFQWAFVKKILDAAPHPDLRHHYFLLWQICGFINWHELFVEN